MIDPVLASLSVGGYLSDHVAAHAESTARLVLLSGAATMADPAGKIVDLTTRALAGCPRCAKALATRLDMRMELTSAVRAVLAAGE